MPRDPDSDDFPFSIHHNTDTEPRGDTLDDWNDALADAMPDVNVSGFFWPVSPSESSSATLSSTPSSTTPTSAGPQAVVLPSFLDMQLNIVRTHAEEQNFAAAAQHLKWVYTSCGHSPEIKTTHYALLHKIGQHYRSQNRFEDAVTVFQGVLRHFPNDAAAREQIGQMYLERGHALLGSHEFLEAEKFLQGAALHLPKDISVALQFARIYQFNTERHYSLQPEAAARTTQRWGKIAALNNSLGRRLQTRLAQSSSEAERTSLQIQITQVQANVALAQQALAPPTPRPTTPRQAPLRASQAARQEQAPKNPTKVVRRGKITPQQDRPTFLHSRTTRNATATGKRQAKIRAGATIAEAIKALQRSLPPDQHKARSRL